MAVNFIIGRKLGMTRIFDEVGVDYPVTIIEAGPCEITQIKTIDKEGYAAIQLGFLEKAKKHVKKSEMGHFNKANVSAKTFLKEVRLNNLDNAKIGEEITTEIFRQGEFMII